MICKFNFIEKMILIIFMVLILSCDTSIDSIRAACTDSQACNYDIQALDDDGSCRYLDEICETCVIASNGIGQIKNNDIDGDDICDSDEIEGCLDINACNYNEDTTDEILCKYIDGICETCENGEIVDNDFDDDDICNSDEMEGCLDPLACNYNAYVTEDDGSCIYLEGNCDICENGEIVDNDFDDDGVCNSDEPMGCIDPLACNYDINAEISDESCYTDDICNSNISLPYQEQDFIMMEHLEQEFDICYGSEFQDVLKLGNFFGKIIHINLAASW